ncbi:hypothetical protein [Mesorhizobium sp. B2-3-4]|uniref:hypothetical protein n=1 Tax=Mesorhizobium sp. B2-3-4 TaxID=2589959 RepID=UPI00112A8E42|nr:hypothetical protein [Mesorhizobium sp. B2-3-4]TPM30023.1 hypothetical protein FJ967_27520 [Mesorhizobium sp. B2-3-4]
MGRDPASQRVEFSSAQTLDQVFGKDATARLPLCQLQSGRMLGTPVNRLTALTAWEMLFDRFDDELTSAAASCAPFGTEAAATLEHAVVYDQRQQPWRADRPVVNDERSPLAEGLFAVPREVRRVGFELFEAVVVGRWPIVEPSDVGVWDGSSQTAPKPIGKIEHSPKHAELLKLCRWPRATGRSSPLVDQS